MSDDDSEYLSKLYDLRTWNMYKLITESRRKRPLQYTPSFVEEESPEQEEEDGEGAILEGDEPSSFTANMIFAFDL
jgi:hypothetical protein